MNILTTARFCLNAGTILTACCLFSGCGGLTGASHDQAGADQTGADQTGADQTGAGQTGAGQTGASAANDGGGSQEVPAAGPGDAATGGSASAPNDKPSSNRTAVSASQDNAQPHQAPAATGRGEIQDITFDDLKCNMQEDIVFRPWMLTERAKELDGTRIRVTGFMLPFDKQDGIESFVLLRNTECKFGPGGKADHLMQVALQDGVTASYRGDRPLEVVGTLKINPFQGPDGNTWCIYDLIGESVKWKRR